MKPVAFPEVNTRYGPPKEMDETHVLSIPAYEGVIAGGPFDGAKQVIVAWEPSPQERALLIEGSPVFITMVGGLAPHTLSVDFQTATRIQ